MIKNGTPQIYKITLFMIKKENYGKFDFFFFTINLLCNIMMVIAMITVVFFYAVMHFSSHKGACM